MGRLKKKKYYPFLLQTLDESMDPDLEIPSRIQDPSLKPLQPLLIVGISPCKYDLFYRVWGWLRMKSKYTYEQ